MTRSEGAAAKHALMVIVGVVASLTLAIAGPARGATPGSSYGYLTTFGASGSVGIPEFNGVAVDSGTGNIFVADSASQVVRVSSPDATLGGVDLTTIDASAVGLPFDVAVDGSDGSLYVAGDAGVFRYLSDGAPTPTYTLDSSFVSPPGIIGFSGNGLAVDPTSHDVLVSSLDQHQVFRLDPTGALISSFDGSGTANGPFTSVAALAVGPTGTVYVGDQDGRHVERFSTTDAPLGALPLPTGSQPIGVAVDPTSGAVVVLDNRSGQTYLDGFSASAQPTFVSRLRLNQGEATGAASGLAWDPISHRIYYDTDGGTVHTFVPATQPGLDAPVISQAAGSTAHVDAVVATGGETTTARIEYCLASAACADFPLSASRNQADPDYDPFSDPTSPVYNASTANPWVRMPPHDGLSSASDETIADDLTGLAPNTSYRVRVFASNVGGRTENTSATVSFSTPLVAPAVETGPAAGVTDVQAELTGTIDTIGDQTTYHFEYGLTTNYGGRVPAGAEGVAGNVRGPRPFSDAITGLAPGTTYHYRLVAQNSAGTTAGADRTFTTEGVAQVAPRRAYEQVTPVVKHGAALNTLGYQAAADGSAVEYILSAAPADAPSAALATRYISRRSTSDWLDWQSADPPQNVSRRLVESVTPAISSDFTHALVISNRALAPGAIETGGNLYVSDLKTGTYTLVGAAAGGAAYVSLAGANSAASIYRAGAPDFSWVVFASQVPLLPNVTGSALYKWTRAGGLTLESPSTGGLHLDGTGVLASRSVSDDGNVMYFDLDSGQSGIYRRSGNQTIAISVSHVPGDPATPQPADLNGVSRDGRYAVFCTSAQLTSDAPLGGLYQYDSANDELRHLAEANCTDGNVSGVSDDAQTVYFGTGSSGTMVWRQGALRTASSHNVALGPSGAQAIPSPNGRYLAFLESDGNAWLYDADSDVGTCVSCPADGEPAGDAFFAAGKRSISNRAPQVVTDSGMMFFDTASRLTSADHNGTRDVYSYQDGRTTLISAGDGNFNARFADASADGSNVFFLTSEPLVGQDTDGDTDVYDARVGGGFAGQSPVAPPAPCVKTECAEARPGPVVSPPVGSPPQPSAPPTRPTNQHRVRLSLAKVTFGSASMTIRFRASERGRVRVTGSRVSTSVRNVAKAGTYSISVPLTKKARAMRRAHKKFKVSVKVTLSAGWGSASLTYSRTSGTR